MAEESFDYVVVGAGSAGCVLANRLSEDGRASVLLLEYGGSDSSILIQMPSAFSLPLNMPAYDWGYRTEPEPHLGGRSLSTPRGKLLGGSSSINGLVYVRGHALDFERWASEGAEGWSYAQVLPYFRRAETRALGGDAWRGESGPLHTCYGRLANPLYGAFIAAAKAAGYSESADLNGFRQEGFGRLDMTVHRGRRWSAANAYLKPALPRRNLALRTRALALEITLEAHRATGVRYDRGGVEHFARARREVILAAGPVNSPQLLKLSGIGPADELKAHGIALKHHLPGVGENLQDHLELYFQLECTQPITLYAATRPLAKALIALRWLLRHDGLGASNHFEVGGFIRSAAGVRHPDLQYHFLPLAMSYDGRTLAAGHGFQVHVGPLRSQSRGRVRLASADPWAKPRLFFDYMSAPEDWQEMRAAVRLTREIMAQAPLARFRGRELQPGEEAVSDAEIDAFVRAKAESAYHPCGTCRMGSAADPLAVVDAETCVIGLERLRVVDSSIMPSITSGNLNAPTIMIAEKAADHIRGRAPPAPSDAAFHVAPDWERRQR